MSPLSFSLKYTRLEKASLPMASLMISNRFSDSAMDLSCT